MQPLILCLFLIFIGRAFAQSTYLEPYNSEPDKTAEPPAAADAVKMIQLPEGFEATVYASEPDVRNPIAMAWDHRGRMWVAENFTYAERQKRFELALKDRVLIFHDKDNDGKADAAPVVFTDQLQRLTSVEIGYGGVWVMCPPQLLFIPDDNRDDVPDGPPEVILDGFDVAESNYHNFANGLRWGPDGWLYGRCGHSCPGKIGTPGTAEADRLLLEGGIWRYHPERDVVEVITHGTTNPWGHDWDQHGELFFINTVNGHLWHGIPGAHFLESFGTDPNPGVYERLDMHADHWHFDTGQHWTKSRAGAANDYGGGHAHIGMMIYQADQWPVAMRHKLYTMNMHGLRTNVERLERHGSGYVGKHEADVFLTKDQWFRGIDLQQGPDGSVYVLDWSDTGECHDSTGVHRTSGRIYRISHGAPATPDLSDLENITPAGIKRLIENPNVWYERQLRQIIATDSGAVLTDLFNKETDPVIQLRILWALNVVGHATPDFLRQLLSHENEHLRVWAIRFLTDQQTIDSIIGPKTKLPPSPDIERFVEMASNDPSSLVRLTLASTLQRLPVEQRAQLGAALANHADDAGDHNLPSMVWYGLIPLIESDPLALARIANQTTWPQLQRWIARSLASQFETSGTPFNTLLINTSRADVAIQRSVLQGIRDAYQGWKNAPEPQAWVPFMAAAKDPSLADTIQELSLLFGNFEALQAVKALAMDPAVDVSARQSALQTLIKNQPKDLREICEPLIDQPGINITAARGLGGFDDPTIGEKLAQRYQQFAQADRSGLLEVLVSRPAWAMAVLTEIKNGTIPRADLAAFHARQIRAFNDETLSAKLDEVWGGLRESPEEKLQMIQEWKTKLTTEHLATADLGQGRIVFQNICGACHQLYGQGGIIGPDLTGSGRKDLGYLLENIVDPGAAVSNDYRMSIITLKDGRIVTGVIASENQKILTLRQIAGEFSIEKETIAARELPAVSMMPEGLLQVLDPTQVRDLIGYLQHSAQVDFPK